MNLKVAIVGCGKIADAHLDELRRLPTLAQPVAVCDREIVMAEQAAMRFGVPRCYDDLERMLTRERPDVLHVATPPQTHLAIAKRGLEAGCHVLVEKPVAPRHAEVIELVVAAEKAGKRLVTNYHYLFDPATLEMRELIARGVLGELVHVETCLGYNMSGDFGRAVASNPSHWVHGLPGGLLQNNVDHMLYKLLELLPDVPLHIDATAFCGRGARGDMVRGAVLDELRFTMRAPETTVTGLFSSHARPVGHWLRLFGTRDTLLVDYTMRTVTLEDPASLPSALGRLVPPFAQAWRFVRSGVRNVAAFARADFHYFAGFRRLLEAFYGSIIDGAPPPISPRDIIRVSEMIEAIVERVTLAAASPDLPAVGGPVLGGRSSVRDYRSVVS